jgi:hypothetical protein
VRQPEVGVRSSPRDRAIERRTLQLRRVSARPSSNLSAKCEEIVKGRTKAHARFYSAKTFGGPSYHFHIRALECAGGSADDFAEPVYAVLVAWGMHRMGQSHTKMEDFAPFRDSLREAWPRVRALHNATPETMDDAGWRDLEASFKSLRCMKSAASIVAHSKVLAHALPNLVPPVDRQYTLQFLLGTQQVANDRSREWACFRSLLEGFFFPALKSKPLGQDIGRWMADRQRFPWDTSRLKVLDNLIIGMTSLLKP